MIYPTLLLISGLLLLVNMDSTWDDFAKKWDISFNISLILKVRAHLESTSQLLCRRRPWTFLDQQVARLGEMRFCQEI